MADIDLGLVVRTKTGSEVANDDLLVKIADKTTAANQLAVDANGRIEVDINDISKGSQSNNVAVDIADWSSTTPIDINIPAGQKIIITDGTDDWSIDSSGYGQIDIAAQSVGDLAVTLDGEEVSLAAGTNVVGIVRLQDATGDEIAITAAGELTTLVTDGTDTLAVNTDGSINVNIVTALSGGEVHDYKAASAVAAAASDNHDYTVSGGTTLKLRQIFVDASGRFKYEIIVDPTGANTTIMSGFGTGANGSGKYITFEQPVEVAATKVIRVTVTNRAIVAQDLYSCIIGEEV